MADVYGRLTGKGVCPPRGPGATNLMTGVADANLDGAPLVAITGQVGTDQMHIEAHQYLDLVAMFAPVTKWNARLSDRAIHQKLCARHLSDRRVKTQRFTSICRKTLLPWQLLANPYKDKLNKTYAAFQYY